MSASVKSKGALPVSATAAMKKTRKPTNCGPMYQTESICLLTMFVSLYAAFGTTQALTDLVVDHTLRRRDTRAEQNADINSSDSGFSFSTGGGVFLTGTVATEDRCGAITELVRRELPGVEVHNDVSVVSLTEPDGAEELK